MHEILQQENGSLPGLGLRPRFQAGNRNLSQPHLRTVKLMRISPIILALALVVLSPFAVLAQANQNGALGSTEIDRIVQAFIAKEIQFRRALNQYSFKRDVLVQKVGMGGQVTGEYHRVSNFTFDDQGNRYEKITFFPMSTMPEITQADIDQMGGINPFALEPEKINEYAFRYVGKEKIDE